MKSLLIVLGGVFLSSSAVGESVECTATAEVTMGMSSFTLNQSNVPKFFIP